MKCVVVIEAREGTVRNNNIAITPCAHIYDFYAQHTKI